MIIQSAKTLRSVPSLPLDKIVNLIQTDYLIDQSNDYGNDFTYANYLCRHVRSHNGEKIYECNQCGKAFARPSQLQRHRVTHSWKCLSAQELPLGNIGSLMHTTMSSSNKCNFTYSFLFHIASIPFSYIVPVKLLDRTLNIYRENEPPCLVCELGELIGISPHLI